MFLQPNVHNEAQNNERKPRQQFTIRLAVGGVADNQKDGADNYQRQSSVLFQKCFHITFHSSLFTSHQRSASFLFGCDELVALAVYVDNLNLRVFLQMLAQLGDIDIH